MIGAQLRGKPLSPWEIVLGHLRRADLAKIRARFAEPHTRLFRAIQVGVEALGEEDPSSVRGVAVTGDGKRAVSASDDKTLKVWDLQTAGCIATFHCDGRATCCAWAGVHRIVAGDLLGRLHYLSLEA